MNTLYGRGLRAQTAQTPKPALTPAIIRSEMRDIADQLITGRPRDLANAVVQFYSLVKDIKNHRRLVAINHLLSPEL